MYSLKHRIATRCDHTRHGYRAGHGPSRSNAVVTFFRDRKANDGLVRGPDDAVETAADGSFAIPVFPRSGYFVVRGPSDAYVLQELDRGLLVTGQAGSQRAHAHKFIFCDPEAGR